MFFSLLFEAIGLAFQEIWNNKMRAFLSVLGISIGIFCVISVQMMVDSVKQNIRQSFQRLGDNIIFIDRFPWSEDPSINWWKYIKRPYVDYEEFKAIRQNVGSADRVSIRIFLSDQEIKYKGSSVSNVITVAPTNDFADILDFRFAYGRFFSPAESLLGSNVMVVGYKVAEELFTRPEDALGKEVRIMGRRVRIVGVLNREGKSLLGDGFDEVALLPYNYIRKYVNTKDEKFMPLIAVRAAPGYSIEQVNDEVTGVLRGARKLKPAQEDNFALNRISLLTGIIDSVFLVLNFAGWIIGVFSILVGGFGIANIMFVSVKERTGIIGIKKSLGAKNYVILIEFLTEAIALCIFGGAMGLASVFILTLVGNQFIEAFKLVLSFNNLMIGFLLSFGIGVIAGFIPALNAARMDPVETIRHNI